MGETKINYVTKTWNPIEGCKPCSPGCERCWARKWATRAANNDAAFADDETGINPYTDCSAWDGTLAEFPDRWDEPNHWRKPQRVFVGSRSDIALWPDRALIRARNVAAECANAGHNHRFLVLTKRPLLLAEHNAGMPWTDNVWFGVTVCNQAEAAAKIPVLLSIPAAGYWVSVEPMLGPVDMRAEFLRLIDDATMTRGFRVARIGWVVCGGESGKGARTMDIRWVRSLRDQCRAAGVPFWFKQWGNNPTRPIEDEDEQTPVPPTDSGDWIDGRKGHQLPDALKVGNE